MRRSGLPLLVTRRSCAHAGFEFVQCEWLDQVVVGTEVKHAHAFGQAVAGGHHQYRQAIAALAQALQHVAAIQLRQAQVQHQQRVLGRTQRGVGVRAVVDVVDHMPCAARRTGRRRCPGRLQQSERAYTEGSSGGEGRSRRPGADRSASRLRRIAANRVKRGGYSSNCENPQRPKFTFLSFDVIERLI